MEVKPIPKKAVPHKKDVFTLTAVNLAQLAKGVDRRAVQC